MVPDVSVVKKLLSQTTPRLNNDRFLKTYSSAETQLIQARLNWETASGFSAWNNSASYSDLLVSFPCLLFSLNWQKQRYKVANGSMQVFLSPMVKNGTTSNPMPLAKASQGLRKYTTHKEAMAKVWIWGGANDSIHLVDN